MIKEELHHLEEQYEKEVTSMVQKSGELLRSKYGLWFLGIVSFADSALSLPILTDPFMVAYIAANRTKAFLGFFVTTAASVLGGVVIYLISELFIEQILSLLSPDSVLAFYQMVSTLNQGTFVIAFLGALTPMPYSFVAIAAGALKGSLFMFIMGSILGRALRFGIVAYFTYYFGERALDLAKNNLKLVSAVAVGIVIMYALYKIYL